MCNNIKVYLDLAYIFFLPFELENIHTNIYIVMYLKYDLKYNNLSEHGLTTQKIKKRLVFPSVCEAPTYLLSALHPQHPWIQPTSEKNSR